MIAYIDIKVNAAHPNIPLAPFYAFQASPSNVRIVNVPQRIGKWQIDAVSVTVTLPDNSATTVPAVNVAGCWVATLPGSDVTGYCAAGLQVNASGIDENGAAVTGYCLGIGDVTVLGRDAAIAADGKRYYLHLLDAVPEVPQEGDTCVINGTLKYYDGMNWQPFAPPVSEALAGEILSAKTIADIRTSIGVIGRALGATVVALAIAALPVFGASVESAALNSLDLDAHPQVVTNVNLSGLATTNDATLSPVITDWSLNPPEYNGQPLGVWWDGSEPIANWWITRGGSVIRCLPIYGEGTEELLHWTAGDSELGVEVTATRSVVGYTLGSQVNKVLASTNDLVKTQTLTNYYTIAETDNAIDALAAYYITANADGDAFATVAALTNATAYYSGGALRTPTRNDYAVVLADETHGGAEWRYIYAVHEGATTGQWEAQYPIETNDYDALANKPQINGVELSGNKSAATLGVATPQAVASATNTLDQSWSSRLSQVSRSSTNYTDHAISTADTSYPRFTSATNLNQSVQYLTTAPNNILSIELPAGTAATKDWIVYAYFGVETALALPAANWWMADESYTNAIPASTPTAFYFSQVAEGIYTISRQELTTITITNP